MNLLDQSAAAVAVLEALPRTGVERLTDVELLELARRAASLQRLASTQVAVVAGEIARRSTRELGHAGLAQRTGFRTPQELVRSTGATGREAGAAVRIGVLTQGDSPLAIAVKDGSLSVAAADAITAGLGAPTAAVPETILTDAAASLLDTGLDPDRLLRRARELRDELDDAGIADREAERFEQRSLKFFRQTDGLSRLTWVMDPETAASVGELFDRATSPKRGGPRFVSGPAAEQAKRIADDTRSTGQLASDVFLQLLRSGADADSSQLLGSGAPVVRIVSVAGVAHGFIEGQTEPVSAETLERLACSGVEQEVTLDQQRQPLNVGREKRLFTKKQRIALAVRDGGCMVEGCNCPPSWTEAHHVRPWKRRGGPTDIANGILLCRFHHLILHNNGWEIDLLRNVLGRDEYWLIPPKSVDPAQTPTLMVSKSRAMREVG